MGSREIVSALELLGKITIGDTITLRSGQLIVSRKSSWYTWSIRKLARDDRNQTLIYVNNVIETAIYNGLPIDQSVITGLQNLRATYLGDDQFCHQIDHLIKKTTNRTDRTVVQDK